MTLNPEQSELIVEKSRVVSRNLAIAGLAGIIVGSAFQCTILNVDIDALISNTGALFLVIAVLQWSFDRNVRESFFTNIHREIVGSSNVQESGICNFFCDSKDVDFTEDFLTSTKLVIGTNYSPKLIDNCIGLLQERSAAGKETTIIRMAPDGHASTLMAHEFFDGQKTQIQGGHSKMDGIVSDTNKIKNTIKVFSSIPF